MSSLFLYMSVYLLHSVLYLSSSSQKCHQQQKTVPSRQSLPWNNQRKLNANTLSKQSPSQDDAPFRCIVVLVAVASSKDKFPFQTITKCRKKKPSLRSFVLLPHFKSPPENLNFSFRFSPNRNKTARSGKISSPLSEKEKQKSAQLPLETLADCERCKIVLMKHLFSFFHCEKKTKKNQNKLFISFKNSYFKKTHKKIAWKTVRKPPSADNFKQQQEQDPTNLYIANLPLNYKETDVENLLSKYGQVISTRILRDQNAQSKGE